MLSAGVVERGDAISKRHSQNSSSWSPLCCDLASFPNVFCFRTKM